MLFSENSIAIFIYVSSSRLFINWHVYFFKNISILTLNVDSLKCTYQNLLDPVFLYKNTHTMIYIVGIVYNRNYYFALIYVHLFGTETHLSCTYKDRAKLNSNCRNHMTDILTHYHILKMTSICYSPVASRSV